MSKKTILVLGVLLGFLFAGMFVSAKDLHATVHNFRFTDKDTMNTIDVLRHASAGDKVHIHINSPGGSVNVLYEVYSALKTTKAEVYCTVEGAAYSAGGFLFLACPNKEVVAGSVLIHLARYHVGGQPVILALDDYWHQEALKLIAPYLDKYIKVGEMDKVLKGLDLVIPSDIMKKRLKNPINNAEGTFLKRLEKAIKNRDGSEN